MNKQAVSAQQAPVNRTNTYLAKAIHTGSKNADTCGPATSMRKIRNITSGAPMMQLIDLIRQQQ